MNKEEILYNEIYERTKDFGRTHFIKEIMRLQREIKELKKQYCERTDCIGRLGNSKKVEKLIKENQELKGRIKTYEEPEDLTLMFMYCDEKAKDKIKELQDRIDKAIDVINTQIKNADEGTKENLRIIKFNLIKGSCTFEDLKTEEDYKY